MELQNKQNKKKDCDLTKLTQIKEVSEEQSVSKTLNQKPIVLATEGSRKQLGINWKTLKYFTNCIKSCCLRGEKKQEFTINEEDMTKQVQKIKKKKSQTSTFLPPSSMPRLKTLVLDLDQTLIFTSFKKLKHYDFSTQVEINGKMEKIYVTKRFGLDIFLFQMSQIYQLVIYTAGTKYYTDCILNHIDLQRRISHVLYRQHCTILNGSYFLKNLGQLGRNLKQTILVDDNSMAGILSPQIFYKIEPFYGNSHDRKLLRLIDFLKEMALEDDFSCLLQKKKSFNARRVKVGGEIKLEAPSEESCGTSKVCMEVAIQIED